MMNQREKDELDRYITREDEQLDDEPSALERRLLDMAVLIEMRRYGPLSLQDADDLGTLAKLLRDLRKAVEDEGPMPGRHREIMRKHRDQWPTLWEAIDQLLKE